MGWLLFIMTMCGEGCVEIITIPFDTYQECHQHEFEGPTILATCEEIAGG